MQAAPFIFPKVQVLPELHRASFRVDGVERLGFEFGQDTTCPFFYPVIGPSGAPLTRIGHPNPVGHEHHKSIWFGHQKIGETNFWEVPTKTDAHIRVARVVAFRDGSDWAAMAADLEWITGGQTVLRQRLIAALSVRDEGEYALDLQSRFESPGKPVEFGKTNFGFLGVRVAKTMSEQFGGGRLTNAEGATGEPAIFGKRSRWVDYSGPAALGKVDGICYFDHPTNPGHPTHWHVRRDGWMEAAFNLAEPSGVAVDHPLDLRYRLLIHSGPADATELDQEWKRFAATPPYVMTLARPPQISTITQGATPKSSETR